MPIISFPYRFYMFFFEILYSLLFLKKRIISHIAVLILFDATDLIYCLEHNRYWSCYFYSFFFLSPGKDGSFWVASEMKVLVEDCVTFDIFPPGHIYDSRQVKKVLANFFLHSFFSKSDKFSTIKL